VKRLWLFLLATGLTGALTVPGSILGGRLLGDAGVPVGALAGGVLGVTLAAQLAGRWALIAPHKEISATIGGLIGFGLAAAIAWAFLGYLLVVLASTALVGVGAVLGSLKGGN
jgi:hypothetical protein